MPTFLGVTAALMLLFWGAASLIDLGLTRAWGVRLLPLLGGSFVIYLVPAIFAADGIFRRAGLSRSGKAVEVRSRTSFGSNDDPTGDVAEARMPPLLRAFTLTAMPLMGMMMIVFPWLPIEGVGPMRWIAPVFGVLFLLFSASTLVDVVRHPGLPQARADADGVTGYGSRMPSRRIFVPWSEILTCDIESNHSTFGTPMLLRPILRGRDGQPLLALNLTNTPMPEQERIVKFIRARLPKVQVDPLEL